jgi:hypothetical protein
MIEKIGRPRGRIENLFLLFKSLYLHFFFFCWSFHLNKRVEDVLYLEFSLKQKEKKRKEMGSV